MFSHPYAASPSSKAERLLFPPKFPRFFFALHHPVEDQHSSDGNPSRLLSPILLLHHPSSRSFADAGDSDSILINVLR